jgi:hypothetical protein
MHIYEIDSNWQRIEGLLEESCGELTPEIEEALGALITESPEALERAGHYVKALEAVQEVCKARRAALAATIERTEAKAEKVRAAMAAVLKRIGKPVKLPEFTLSTQTRTSYAFAVAPGVEVFELPTQFWKQPEPELVKSALNEAAKAGTLPESITCLESTNTSLMIRTPTKKSEPIAA